MYLELCIPPGSFSTSLVGMADVESPTTSRVIVIGAGAAGLAAARALMRRGDAVDVVILEARSRIGGRMDSRVFADGTCVDMGASWVHGAGPGNPLVGLAAKTPQGTLVPTDWDHTVSFEIGDSVNVPARRLSKIDEEEGRGLMQRTWDLLKQWQSRRRGRARAAGVVDTEADQDLWSCLRQLRSKRFQGIDSLCARSRALLLWRWAEQTEHDYAASLEQLSALWWDIDAFSPGEFDSQFVHGYRVIVEVCDLWRAHPRAPCSGISRDSNRPPASHVPGVCVPCAHSI